MNRILIICILFSINVSAQEKSVPTAKPMMHMQSNMNKATVCRENCIQRNFRKQNDSARKDK